MKNLLFALFFSILTSFTAFSQALSGVYTIGSGGDYPTISAAASALTTNGVSGPVTMNILSGTYNEAVTIGAIAGTSAVNNVLFKSQANDSTAVTINFTTSATQSRIFYLLGAKHVQFKYLTIENLGAYTSPCLITIAYLTTDIKISNCILLGGRVEIASNLGSSSNNVGANNIYIEKNRFENTPNWFIMSSGYTHNTNIYIHYNKFLGTATSSMSLAKLSNFSIIGNELSVVGSTKDIVMVTSLAPVLIEKNKINSAASNYSIDVSDVYTTSANRVTIKNNMIRNTDGGCLRINSLRTDILYNTFKTLGLNLTCVTISQSSNQVIRNNIFDAVNGLCVNYLGTSYLNNNNSNNAYYNTSGLVIKLGSNIYANTIAQFQALYPTIEANSVYGQPVYLNPNDLHLGWSFPHDGAALPLTSVTTDIDGQTRSTTIPDIGADEFSIPTGNNNDIKILKIISPDSTLCIDQDNLLVRVKNNSLDTFTYFTGKWYLNNTLKNSSIYPVYILPGDSAVVNFGTFDFNEQTFYKLKFEAIFPNGLLDILPANGVKDINYYYVTDLEIKEKKYLECSTQKELAVPQLAYGNYVWSGGQTTNKIIVTTPGTYSVTLQYMGTCTASDSITIN